MLKRRGVRATMELPDAVASTGIGGLHGDGDGDGLGGQGCGDGELYRPKPLELVARLGSPRQDDLSVDSLPSPIIVRDGWVEKLATRRITCAR